MVIAGAVVGGPMVVAMVTAVASEVPAGWPLLAVESSLARFDGSLFEANRIKN